MSEANKIPLCKGGRCVAPGGFMPQMKVKTAKSLLRCALSPFTKVRKLIRYANRKFYQKLTSQCIMHKDFNFKAFGKRKYESLFLQHALYAQI